MRQGTVSVVNNLGSGILENPALLPFLPQLCEQLLAGLGVLHDDPVLGVVQRGRLTEDRVRHGELPHVVE